jgi:hypothetical protein
VADVPSGLSLTPPRETKGEASSAVMGQLSVTSVRLTLSDSESRIVMLRAMKRKTNEGRR